ncbi:MAG: hypothetical protein GC161_04000 [Planctomycetaceae bacterium]|nr:hypothetical protein [Planctomycetaceae bacterium]
MTSSLRTVLVLLAGAVLGFGLGWWLFDGERPTPPLAALGPAHDSAPKSEEGGTLQAPRGGTLGPSNVTLEPSGAVESRRSALATELPAAATGGTGRLRGQVTTRDNRPLPGVTIEISLREERTLAFDPARRGPAFPSNIHVARLVQTTDEQGAFEFADLVDALWDLRATAEGWTIEPLRLVRGPVGSNANVALVATPLLRVPISVLRADGTPAERALIEVQTPAGPDRSYRHWEWTPSAPHLELPDTAVELRALAEEQVWLGLGQQVASAWASPLAIADATSGPLVLTLAPRVCLIGAVADTSGDRGVPQGTLALCLPLDGRGLPAADNWSNKVRSMGITTLPRFQFLDLEPGHHGLGLRVGAMKTVTGAVELELPTGITRRDLSLSTAELPSIRLVLHAHDGTPYAGDLMVGLSVHTGDGRSYSVVNVLRLPDGTVEIPAGHRATEFLLGTSSSHAAALELRTKTYGTKDVELIPRKFDYEARFAEPSSLVLHVTGARPSSAEAWLGVKLTRLEMEVAEEGKRRASAESMGVHGSVGEPIEIGPIEPGTYRVELEWCRGVRDEHWDSRRLAQQTIQLAPGTNSVQMDVPLLHELLVVGGTELVGRRVRATAFDLPPGVVGGDAEKFDALGEARIVDLPAGRYLVNCDDRVAWAQVPGPTLSMPFAAPSSVVLKLGDEPGALAAAGFRTGDRILKVDGKALGEGPSVQDVLRTLGFGSDRVVRFDVERDGVPFALDLSLEDIKSDDALGASLHFAP